MLAFAVAEYFKYKVISSIIIVSCSWNKYDQIKFTHELTQQGISVTFSDDFTALNAVITNIQGILYFKQDEEALLKVKPEFFSIRYKWLIVGEKVPDSLNTIRYDADIVILKTDQLVGNASELGKTNLREPVYLDDIYVHPRDGASRHPWAVCTHTGMTVLHNIEKIRRRHDLRKYAMKISTPVVQYADGWYEGTFREYLLDESMPERDSSVRSGFISSALVMELVNATEILLPAELWNSIHDNRSMLQQVSVGTADLTGAILRILKERVEQVDYIIPVWPFRVGFTYLSERESSSNMFLEPFTSAVWWCVLAIFIVLFLAQRVTSKAPEEKDGAFMSVLATWLQQDAGAVPNGLSGRFCFTVMSVSAMLVYAYYTSSIVSALMSSGGSGPTTLRALGDSKYAIASEGYDYMKLIFFEVKTNWDDLEYLKKKKKTSKMYQEITTGVKLIEQGNTAYHTEYNQLFPHMKTFTDDHICKLQHIDTIAQTVTWIMTTKRGQYTELFKSRGAWLLETGLVSRMISKIRIRKPECRSALLAERVKLGDVAPLLLLTIFGAVLALIILGIEKMIVRGKGRKISRSNDGFMVENFVEE